MLSNPNGEIASINVATAETINIPNIENWLKHNASILIAIKDATNIVIDPITVFSFPNITIFFDLKLVPANAASPSPYPIANSPIPA